MLFRIIHHSSSRIPPNFQNYATSFMKVLFPYLARHKDLVALALLLAMINQVFSMFDPYLVGRIIDQYLNQAPAYYQSEFIKGAGLLLLAIVGVALVSRIAKNFQDYFVNVITQRVGARMYADGLAHSLDLPYHVFENQRSGTTLNVLQKVRNDVERLISASVNIVFTASVGLAFVAFYASTVNWLVVPAYLSTVPLLGSVTYFLGGKIKKIQKHLVTQSTELAGSTVESLRNIELIKALGLAQQETVRLNRTTDRILDLELQKVKYLRMLSFAQGTVVNLLRTGIMFLLLFLVYKGEVTPGQFMTLLFYSFAIFNPLLELGNVVSIFRESETSLENFAAIMAIPKEAKPENPVQLNQISSLAFQKVSYSYENSKHKAVEQVNLEVGKGETIAFVGPSGSGKSTIIKLLVGLYRPQEGNIVFDNHKVEEIDLDMLRNQIGLVTQETHLFAGSIRENLLFVNPDATDQQLWNVLDMASCQNLMARADNGLDTYIGEGGVKVSGGEKQRLAIARALLRSPQILIFDEATSALDSLTEEEIMKTIEKISAGKNHLVVMVAHRLSTVMKADRIYVMEKGRILEKGSHQALLEVKGLYQAMWRQQIGERRETAIV